jgi:putative DNA primase/helicase
VLQEQSIAGTGLRGVRADGRGGFVALCPCHEDHEPSLHLWTDDAGNLAFSCLAGCEWSDVREKLKELGLSAAGPAVEVTPDPLVVGTYDYRDEVGALVYQVVRYLPKGFRQRRPNGSGGWIWNMKGVPRLLFRLPELIDGIAAGKTIYVTEGEKDALAIVGAGGVATCSSGGAGKWRDEYRAHFVGANVIIVADKDETGRRHAAKVAASLQNVATTVRIAEAREGKDAFDHLSAGHGLDDLVPAGATTPAEAAARTGPVRSAFITAPQLAESEDEPVAWIVPDYIAEGSTTQLTGQPKAGKTTLALCLADAVASGRPFLGRPTTKGPVVYLTEQTKSSFKASARGTGVLQNPNVHLLLRSRVWSCDWSTIIAEAVAYCLEVGAKLLIVDTLGRWASLDGDAENDAGAALAVMQPLEEAAAAGLAVLALRHERKNPGADIVDAGRGSSAYAGVFDQLLALKRVGGAGHENRRRLCCEGRFEETPKELVIDYEADIYEVRGTNVDVERARVRVAVLDLQPGREDEAWGFEALRSACGEATAKSTLERVLGVENDPSMGKPASGLLGEGLVRRAKGAGSASSRAYGYWGGCG